jgi:hypothetical protein
MKKLKKAAIAEKPPETDAEALADIDTDTTILR